MSLYHVKLNSAESATPSIGVGRVNEVQHNVTGREDKGRPYIYDTKQQCAWVGQPYGLHWDMIAATPELSERYNIQESHMPNVLPNMVYGRAYEDDNEVQLVHSIGSPEDDEAMYDHLHQIMGKHFGKPATGGDVIDDWTFAKVADVERDNPQHHPNWTPGNHGKGIVFRNGEVHTWNTGTQGGNFHEDDGKPFHHDYIDDVLGGKTPGRTEQFFHITPEGHATHSQVNDEYVREAQPELSKDKGDWTFSRVANVPVQNGDHHVTNYLNNVTDHRTTPWEPGMMGKLLLLPEGLHMWGIGNPKKAWPHSDSAGYFDPHHDGVYDHLRGQHDPSTSRRDHYADYGDAPKMYIGPDGAIDPGIGRGSTEQAIQIAEMHPDLKPPKSAEWDFTAKTSGVINNTWERARWGKGILTADGDAYFWAVDKEGAPHHSDFVSDNIGEYDHRMVELLIKPNGIVDMYTFPTDDHKAEVEGVLKLFGNNWPRFMKPGNLGNFYEDNKLDPFKLPKADDWLFAEAKTASAVQIIQAPKNEEWVDTWGRLDNRRPILFDGEKKILYVGNPGWHHTGIFETMGLGEWSLAYGFGWIGDNGEHQRSRMQGEVGWYSHGEPEPEDKAAIHEALTRELGINTGAAPEEDWHFATTNEYDEEEEEFDEDEYLEQEGWLDARKNFDHNEPVREVDHPMPAGDHYDMGEWDEDSELHHERPAIFDGKRFYLGKPNAYHWDMIQHDPELQAHFNMGQYMGTDPGTAAQDRNTLAMGRHNPETESIMWSHKGKWRRDQFKELIDQHFNGAYDESEDMGMTDADDGWHFGRTAYDQADDPNSPWYYNKSLVEEWKPGYGRGKFIITPDGVVHAWKTIRGAPHHFQYAEDFLGYSDVEIAQVPEGTVQGWITGGEQIDMYGPANLQEIAHKYFATKPEDGAVADWEFASKTSATQPWQKGQSGKLLVTPEGDVYHWTVDDHGCPHHDEYALANGLTRHYKDWLHTSQGYIAPDGRLEMSVLQGSEEDGVIALKAIPGTFPTPEDDEWRFSALGLRPWVKTGIHSGKFVVTPEGDVHHWSVDKRGAPAHNEAIQRLGLPEEVTGYTYGYIDPDGSYETESSGIDQGEVAAKQLGLKLKDTTNAWYFAAADWRYGSKGVNFKHHKVAPSHNLNNGGPEEDGWGGRIPMIYEHRTNTIHTGPPDIAHYDVEKFARQNGEPITAPLHRGWIGYNPEAFDRGEGGSEDNHTNFGWYDEGFNDEGTVFPHHVNPAIMDHFGIKGGEIDDYDDMSGWVFGTTSAYTPGQDNKGTAYANGTIDLWPVNSSGAPHHDDMPWADALAEYGITIDDTADTEWRFGSSKPKMIEMPDPVGSDLTQEAYGPRKPFIYYPPHDTIYLGSSGAHHPDIEEHFDIPWASGKDAKVYGIVQTGKSVGFGASNDVGVRTTGTGDPHHQHIIDHLADHFGIPGEDQESKKREYWPDWEFESKIGALSYNVINSDVTPEQSFLADDRDSYTHSPFIVQDSTIYVGEQGTHHADLIWRHVDGEADPGDAVYAADGWGHINNGVVHMGEANHPHDEHAIGEAVAKHTGLPYERREDNTEWEFNSKVGGPLPQVTVHPDDEDHITKMYGYKGRKPMIYDPTNNHLHVGDDGEAHFNLCDRIAQGDDRERARLVGQSSHGWLGNNPEADHGDDIHNSDESNEYGWYDAHPGEHVDQALTTHFNASLDTNDEWHFTASAIKVVQCVGEADIEGMMTRRPLIWDQNTQTVYVGQPGWHHSGIESTEDIPDMGLGYGWIGDGELYGANEYGDVGWYNHSRPQDDEMAGIHQALEQKLGIDTTPEPAAPADWSFKGAYTTPKVIPQPHEGPSPHSTIKSLEALTAPQQDAYLERKTNETKRQARVCSDADRLLALESHSQQRGSGGIQGAIGIPDDVQTSQGSDPRGARNRSHLRQSDLRQSRPSGSGDAPRKRTSVQSDQIELKGYRGLETPKSARQASSRVGQSVPCDPTAHLSGNQVSHASGLANPVDELKRFAMSLDKMTQVAIQGQSQYGDIPERVEMEGGLWKTFGPDDWSFTAKTAKWEPEQYWDMGNDDEWNFTAKIANDDWGWHTDEPTIMPSRSKLYHAAPKTRQEQIQAQGLEARNTGAGPDDELGAKAVWVMKSPSYAKGYESAYDTWVIDASGLLVYPVENGEWVLYESVGPERLSLDTASPGAVTSGIASVMGNNQTRVNNRQTLPAPPTLSGEAHPTPYPIRPWTPGNTGKWIILPDGKVHHWNDLGEQGAGRSIHHGDYLEAKGLQLRGWEGWPCGYIHVTGEVEAYGGQHKAQAEAQVVKQVPGTVIGKGEDWTYSNTQCHSNSLAQRYAHLYRNGESVRPNKGWLLSGRVDTHPYQKILDFEESPSYKEKAASGGIIDNEDMYKMRPAESQGRVHSQPGKMQSLPSSNSAQYAGRTQSDNSREESLKDYTSSDRASEMDERNQEYDAVLRLPSNVRGASNGLGSSPRNAKGSGSQHTSLAGQKEGNVERNREMRTGLSIMPHQAGVKAQTERLGGSLKNEIFGKIASGVALVTPKGCEPWAMGTMGKAFLFKGTVYAWATDAPTSEPDVAYWGSPHHGDVEARLGINGEAWFYIHVDGGVESAGGDYPEIVEVAQAIGGHPTEAKADWGFGKVASTNGGFRYRSEFAEEEMQIAEPWEPGVEGKYAIVDGEQHLWASDYEGEPHHGQVFPQGGMKAHGAITPDGTVDPYYGDGSEIVDAHPGLKQGKGEWHFASQEDTQTPQGCFPVRLGEWGKGFKLPDGRIFSWATKDGAPHHESIAKQFGHGYDEIREMFVIDDKGDWKDIREIPFSWRFNKTAATIDHKWTPGQYGRAILRPDGSVYTWNCGGYPETLWNNEELFHGAMAEKLGLTYERGTSHLYIEPDGEVHGSADGTAQVQAVVGPRQEKPELKTEDSEDGWNFSKVAKVVVPPIGPGIRTAPTPWEPGMFGKGFVHPETNDVWLWGQYTNYGRQGVLPHHVEVIDNIIGPYDDDTWPPFLNRTFLVGEGGEVTKSVHIEGVNDFVDQVVAADPRLKKDDGSGWIFAKTAAELRPWALGDAGRAFSMNDGSVHHWSDGADNWGPDATWHDDAVGKLDLDYDDINYNHYIDPDGTVRGGDPAAKEQVHRALPLAKNLAPEFRDEADEEWTFSKVADWTFDEEPADEVSYKWIMDKDRVYMLPHTDTKKTYHAMVAAKYKLDEMNSQASGVIDPTGRVEFWHGRNDPKMIDLAMDEIQKVLPHAEYVEGIEHCWAISKVANDWTFDEEEEDINGWKLIFDKGKVYMMEYSSAQEPVSHDMIEEEYNLGAYDYRYRVYGAMSPDFGVEFYNQISDVDAATAISRIRETYPKAHYVAGYDFGSRIAASGSVVTPDVTRHRLYKTHFGEAQPWGLGVKGKGLIHDGQVYAWRAEGYDPHHPEVMETVNRSYGGRGLEQMAKNLFTVDPDGTVQDSFWGGADIDAIVGAHPDWKKPTGEKEDPWSFNSSMDLAGDPSRLDSDEKGLHPIVYTDTKEVIVGHEGLHHKDIHPNPTDHYTGVACVGENKDADWTVGTIEWFGKDAPDDHPAVDAEVSKQLGVEVKTDLNPKWKFSKVGAKVITPEGCRPWMKGFDGRYLVEGDTIWRWHADDATHEHIIDLYGVSSDDGGYITPEGKKDPWFGPEQNWVFGKTAKGNTPWQEGEKLEPWELGKRGKGLFLDGTPHMWAITDQWDGPHHGDAAYAIDPSEEQNIEGYFHISEDGTVEAEGHGDSYWFADHDPRLKPADRDAPFTFSRAVGDKLDIGKTKDLSTIPPNHHWVRTVDDTYLHAEGHHEHIMRDAGLKMSQQVAEMGGIASDGHVWRLDDKMHNMRLDWTFSKVANMHHKWTPGNDGKGFLLADGTPVTWNTETDLFEDENKPQYNSPHHSEYAEGMGLSEDPIDNHDQEGADWHTPIYIDHDGSYETADYWPDALHKDGDQFATVGLKKKTEPSDWTFSKVASEPPHFIHTEMHEDDSQYQGWDEHKEHAIIYHPEDNAVYVGKPRIHHDDLMTEFGLNYSYDNMPMGDVTPGGLFVDHYGFDQHPEVVQHIKDYFGAHKRAEDDEWGWAFTSNAKPPAIADYTALQRQIGRGPYGVDPQKIWEGVREGWQPGHEGKGILVNDELYTWKTWDDDGTPHHPQVQAVLEYAGIRFRRPFYIDAIFPDGEFDASDAATELITVQDPRLHVSEGEYEPNAWAFQ